MKNIKLLFAVLVLALFNACNIDDFANPNGSSIEGFDKDATNSDLQTLITGSEDLLRQDIGFYYDVTAIIGREYYFFTGSDPRYTGELLGRGDSELDNAGFYGTRPYSGRYRTIKNLNVLLNALDNTSFVSDAEKKGYRGFAKTMQAYEYHIVDNLQYDNGIRIDVKDPTNLGPFVDHSAALTAIRGLLDEAYNDLQGASFSFKLSAAFGGFDDADSFAKFNRALAARIALYQGDKGAARSYLAQSFLDMNGDLTVGPGRFFSTAGGDFANEVYRIPNQADAIVAHPLFVTNLANNDSRASKIQKRNDVIALDGLSGDHDVVVYTSLSDPIPYIRNEELVLIMAEANIGSNNTAAVQAINAVRNAAGIGDYTGATDDAALLNEVVTQRRFSLYGEGHRWVDMRRLGRLDQLPLDRADDNVWTQMPRPVSEN